MLQKISLILKRILSIILYIFLLSFIFTNTDKIKIQIVPFFYFLEIRLFLLIIISFIFGIFFSKILEYLNIKSFFGELKNKKYLKSLEEKVKENEKK